MTRRYRLLASVTLSCCAAFMIANLAHYLASPWWLTYPTTFVTGCAIAQWFTKR